jgi:hypothetical protein
MVVSLVPLFDSRYGLKLYRFMRFLSTFIAFSIMDSVSVPAFAS